MPMITTTIRSSISVKPLRFIPFLLSVRYGFPTPLSATVMPYRLEKAQAKRGQRLTRAEHAVYAPEAPTGDLQPAIHIATRYKHGWVTSIPKSAVCAPCLNLPEGEKRPGSFSLIPRQLQALVRQPHAQLTSREPSRQTQQTTRRTTRSTRTRLLRGAAANGDEPDRLGVEGHS